MNQKLKKEEEERKKKEEEERLKKEEEERLKKEEEERKKKEEEERLKKEEEERIKREEEEKRKKEEEERLKKEEEERIKREEEEKRKKEEGEAIDEDGYIVQYFKEEKNGFTIGIENRGRTKEKFKLILEGLDFTDSVNRGKGTSSPFELGPNQRKVWFVSLKKRYTGDLSFQFDYA